MWTYRDGMKVQDGVDLQHNMMPDATMQMIQNLTARIAHLENEVHVLHETQHMHQTPSLSHQFMIQGDDGDGVVI